MRDLKLEDRAREAVRDVKLPRLIGTLADLPDYVQTVVEAYGRACARTGAAAVLSSRDFYARRCDALQEIQGGMRDPERKAVCDILANGKTYVDLSQEAHRES